MTWHREATAIHAVPAEVQSRGFRLLVLREFRTHDTPPAFAYIAQDLLRGPVRASRHGLSFANALRPEIVDWLIAHVGRPSQRDEAGSVCRNPRWPQITWHHEERQWHDGTRTFEWFATVVFADETTWKAFASDWQARLMGQSDAACTWLPGTELAPFN